MSDLIDGTENCDKCEKLLDFLISADQSILNLYSFFSGYKAEALFAFSRQQRFDLNSFTEHVPSNADCDKIANKVLQQNLLCDRFQSVKFGVGSEDFYIKHAIELLQREHRTSNVGHDIFF